MGTPNTLLSILGGKSGSTCVFSSSPSLFSQSLFFFQCLSLHLSPAGYLPLYLHYSLFLLSLYVLVSFSEFLVSFVYFSVFVIVVVSSSFPSTFFIVSISAFASFFSFYSFLHLSLSLYWHLYLKFFLFVTKDRKERGRKKKDG